MLSFPFQFFLAVMMAVFFINNKMLMKMGMNNRVRMSCPVMSVCKGMAF